MSSLGFQWSEEDEIFGHFCEEQRSWVDVAADRRHTCLFRLLQRDCIGEKAELRQQHRRWSCLYYTDANEENDMGSQTLTFLDVTFRCIWVLLQVDRFDSHAWRNTRSSSSWVMGPTAASCLDKWKMHRRRKWLSNGKLHHRCSSPTEIDCRCF